MAPPLCSVKLEVRQSLTSTSLTDTPPVMIAVFDKSQLTLEGVVGKRLWLMCDRVDLEFPLKKLWSRLSSMRLAQSYADYLTLPYEGF